MLKMQHCLFALFSGLAIKEFLSVDNSRIKKDAGDGTWTHTILRPQAPEACASANSATPAFLSCLSGCPLDKIDHNSFSKKSQHLFWKNFNFFDFIKNRDNKNNSKSPAEKSACFPTGPHCCFFLPFAKLHKNVVSGFAGRQKNNAGDGTWTHTILRPQAPEACASANSATPAFLVLRLLCAAQQNIYYQMIPSLSTAFFKFFNFFQFFWMTHSRTPGRKLPSPAQVQRKYRNQKH